MFCSGGCFWKRFPGSAWGSDGSGGCVGAQQLPGLWGKLPGARAEGWCEPSWVWGAPEGAASGQWCWWWRRGGSWALASPTAGPTVTGSAPQHGSQQGGPISATAGARLGQSPALWLWSWLPGTKCSSPTRASAPGREGKGRARAGPLSTTQSFTCEGRLRVRPRGVWGPVGAVCGVPASHPGAAAPSFPASSP